MNQWVKQSVAVRVAGLFLAISVVAPSTADENEVAVIFGDEHGSSCAFEPPMDAVRYQLFTRRWGFTATDAGTLLQGDPTTLTWGILPDAGATIGSDTCGRGEPTAPSSLIAVMDSLYGAGGGGADLTQRPWFTHLQQAFDRWEELTGIDFVYEPNDDEASWPWSNGVLGVRPDIRIAGRSIDGSGFGTLACSYFPNRSDLVFDTDNAAFLATIGSLPFRNVLAHELGHGIGFYHVCPQSGTKLMEPNNDNGYDGPQQDDILAANRFYGDFYEFPASNDTPATATDTGNPGGSSCVINDDCLAGQVCEADVCLSEVLSSKLLSLDGSGDVDIYSVNVAASSSLDVTVTPTGTTYKSGPQNSGGSCSAGSDFNALSQNDLALEILDTDGSTVLASIDDFDRGLGESLSAAIPASGSYYVRVSSGSAVQDSVQMYQLSIEGTAPAPDVEVVVSAGQSEIIAGESVSFEYTITNIGAGTATQLSYSIFRPDGTGSGGTVASLDPGQSFGGGLGYNVDVFETADQVYTVEVDVAGDTNATNDSDQAVVTVIPANSDLALTVEALSDPATAGGSLSYRLSVENQGNIAASVAGVRFFPDAESNYLRSEGCLDDPALCSFGAIQVGQTATATVQVAVQPGAVGPLLFDASSEVFTPDLNSANDDASISTEVRVPDECTFSDLVLGRQDRGAGEAFLSQETIIATSNFWAPYRFLSVEDPPSLEGTLAWGRAFFGPNYGFGSLGTSMALIDDGGIGDGLPNDGCQAAINGATLAGKIALIHRGSCDFVVKVKNAQNAGAVAAIIMNNQGDGVTNMSGDDPTITIRSLFIGQSDGEALEAVLPGVALSMRTGSTELRAGASVHLESSFKVESGAELRVVLDSEVDCTGLRSATIIPAGEEVSAR